MAGVHDGAGGHDTRQGAHRQRPCGALQGSVSGYRERKLGLRRQYDSRVLPESIPDLQPLRAQLQSGAAGKRQNAEDRGWARWWRIALDRLDGDHHERLPATYVELGDEWPVVA